MAISFTNKTNDKSAVGATSYATASTTPAANKLQLLTFVSRTGISADPNQPTATGCSLTWVVIASVVFDNTSSSRRRLTLFRAMGASPTTGAITIDEGGQSQTSATWSLDEVTGMDTTGTNGSGAIVQSVSNFDASATVNTLTVTLAAFSSINNATWGSFGNSNITNQAMSVGSGYTLEANNGDGVATQFLTEYELSNNTAVVVNMAANSEVGGIAVEVKAAVAVTTNSNFLAFT